MTEVTYERIIEDEWIDVEMKSEEDIILHCWKSIPCEISYDDFKKGVYSVKHQQSKFVGWLWCISSYTITLYNNRYIWLLMYLYLH